MSALNDQGPAKRAEMLRVEAEALCTPEGNLTVRGAILLLAAEVAELTGAVTHGLSRLGDQTR
jgi:hypothetical protein